MVLQLLALCSISMSVNFRASLAENLLPSGNRFSFMILTVSSPCWKHGRSFCPMTIISTRTISLSACSCRAMNPCWSSFRNLVKVLEFSPPRTSTNSCVSLNGAFSNFRPFPGKDERRKPKSMWTM